MQARNFTTNVPKIDQSSGFKEKENCCLVFPSSTKHEIRHFHVVVMQRLQSNVQKSLMHMQSCCFGCLNLLLFCYSCCRNSMKSLMLMERMPFQREYDREHIKL